MNKHKQELERNIYLNAVKFVEIARALDYYREIRRTVQNSVPFFQDNDDIQRILEKTLDGMSQVVQMELDAWRKL